MINFKNLPKIWQIKKLGEILSLQDNGIWGEEDLKSGIPILRSTNFNNDGTVNFSNTALRKIKNTNLNDKRLKKGDILLERSGGGPKQPVGRVVYFDSDNEYYFGNFLTRLRPSEKIYSKFLFYFLFNLHQKGITNALQKQTTGIRNLRFKEYLTLEIPLPPLPDQRRIVKRIEELFEKIDKAKKLREEVNKEAENLIPAALNQIFNGEAKIGWQRKKMKEILKLVQYGISKQMNNESKGYKIFRMDNIINSRMNNKNIKFVDINEQEFLQYRLQKGDVLFNRVNSYELVGKTGIFDLDGDYVFASYLIRLKSDPTCLNPYFLNYFLNSPGTQAKLRFIARRAVNQANINAKEVSSLEIPFPALSEQHRIVKYLDSLQSKVESLKKLQQETLTEIESLKKSILDKSFKGE
jgi:type I restriction enzyme S subunit